MKTGVTKLLAGAALAAALAAGPAAAQGLDGIWRGTAKAEGKIGWGSGAGACQDSTVELNIVGERVRGAAFKDGSYYIVEGKVTKDGTVEGFYSDDKWDGKFSGDSFTGTAVSAHTECRHHVKMTRAR